MTNYTATMTVRPFVGANTTTVVASTDNGRIALQSQGRVVVNLDASITAAITPGRYSYDLVLDSGGVVTRILEGKFVVTGAVTTS